jgi:hypothetical protein
MKPQTTAKIIAAASVLATAAAVLVRSMSGVQAVTRAPTNPIDWTVPAWFIDPSNSSGVANDGNSCKTSLAPCLHYYEIDARWGCTGHPTGCPVLNQNTTITWMSSTSKFNDPVIFRPAIGVVNANDAGATTGPTIILQGTTTSGSASTFTLTTAKNRATNARFAGTFSPAISSSKMLLQNTTHPSLGWIATGSQLSQPMTAVTITTGGIPTSPGSEVDTWATNDSITPITLPSVWITEVNPVPSGLSGEGVISIYRLDISENASAGVQPGDDRMVLGSAVQIHESVIEKQIFSVQASQSFLWNSAPTIDNSSVFGGFVGGQLAPLISGSDNGQFLITAGQIQSQSLAFAGTGNVMFNGVWLDDDVYLRSGDTIGFTNHNFIGTAQFESTAIVYNGILDLVTYHLTGSNIIFGGTGSTRIDVGRGQFLIPSGASGAANAIHTGGAPRIQGGTLACLGLPGAGGITIACNKTISQANIDTDMGATTGCYFVAGSGSICNSAY